MSLDHDDDIVSLAHRLLDCALPKREWTHEAHFAAALWAVSRRPDLADPMEFRSVIMRYNAASGTENSDTSGYHHTITVASLRAASDWVARWAGGEGLAAMLAGLMASPLGRSDWLLTHWHKGTLFSVAARRGWVEPDIRALPF